ncbi:right-handed parallel beta-helix repeat-containing protein [Hymenobacter guriensis]|uniref:Right-handed parallel beta-helix repeat-containing protein n=1 Tax=Hymenobacter guriensis TaxID=2793065 RepID=A0ABS0L8L1_9BACT|nr:hypothetical protein [Hymenobacter guriensis]MBG8555868.1 hypothetical protein [Hymenobacter guriensis]
MKKLYAFLLLGLSTLLAASGAFAQTIRRVNNNGITGTNIYSTIQAAHDAAAANDIIQVEPSTTSYGSLTCSKKLTIVGPGYFLDMNTGLQASPIPATVSSVDFYTGSAGSSVSGLTISNAYLRANNVTISRNKIDYLYVGYYGESNQCVVRQNYIYYITTYGYTANDLLVTNNIFTYYVGLSNSATKGEFNNNVVMGNSASFDGFTVKNNYFGVSFTPTGNTTWSYNKLAQASLPASGTQSNNTANVAYTSILAWGSGTQYDAWFKLKAGGPGIGTGEGGVDIGAFDSPTGYDYKLSGIPAVPSIYEYNQSVNGNTLNVNLSTRSNN